MKSSSKINQLRRKILSGLTSFLLPKTSSIDENKLLPLEEIKKVLICRPNSRLGNQLLITPFIQELVSICPEVEIDVFVRGGSAKTVFKYYPNIKNVISLPAKPFKQLFSYLKVWLKLRNKKYDIVINVVDGSSSGRIATKLVSSKIKLFFNSDQSINFLSDSEHIAKAPVLKLRRFFTQYYALSFDNKSIPMLNINLSKKDKDNGLEVLNKIIPDSTKKTIGLYTFATGLKCYSSNWWNSFYDMLVERYAADYNILEVLPKENISQIGFRSISYYSMNLLELAGVLSNLSVFISADCGIMHLASASSVPVLGLFSVTGLSTYGVYNDRSVSIDTNIVGMEEIFVAIDSILNKE